VEKIINEQMEKEISHTTNSYFVIIKFKKKLFKNFRILFHF